MLRHILKIFLLGLLTIPNAHAGFFSDIVDSISTSNESMTEDEKAHPEAYRFNKSGIKKYNEKDFKGAIADFTRATELYPEYALAYRNRGNSKGSLDDDKGWMEDVTRAIALEPTHASYYVDRANAKYFLKDWAGRVSDYEKAASLDPTNQDYKNKLNSAKSTLHGDVMVAAEEKSNLQAYTLFQSGMTKFKAKDYQGAIVDFNGAIKADPKFAEAYKSRGNAKGWLDDNQGWVEDVTRAITLEPTNASYYVVRADAKSYLKDYVGRVSDLEKAVALDPNNQEYKNTLNGSKSTLQWDTMMVAEEKLHPQAYTLYQSGMTKFRAKDYHGAIDDFNGAIKADPKFAEAYKKRGDAKGWLDDDKGWMEDVTRAITLEPTNASYYVVRADAKSYLKDLAGRVSDLEKAASLDPNNQGYKEKLNNAKVNLRESFVNAMIDRDMEKATKLLEGSGRIDLDFNYSKGQNTALGRAVTYGTLEIVELLVSKGADVNRLDDSYTPLQRAAMGQDYAMAAYLIDHGANLNTMCPKYGTALHIATFFQGEGDGYRGGYRNIEKLLISKGADTTLKNEDGYTAFEWDKFRKDQQEKERIRAEKERIREAKEQEAQRSARQHAIEAAQKAIQQAQYDEDAAYERETADVLRRMSGEANANAARVEEAAKNSQPSFWDRNAETLGNNLKTMQEGDAARRNADYRLQNNCSGANCVNR